MWVLIRQEDGRYVSRVNSQDSYTKTLEKARIFNSKEEASKDACGNEYPIRVEDILLYGNVQD